MAPPLLGRPPIQKSYTERETTSSIEAQREREKLEREREREQKRAYAYRQGTIGIAFEGGTAAPALPAKEGEQLSEMREKRRPPPMSTMSSNNSTAGSASGWDRNR